MTASTVAALLLAEPIGLSLVVGVAAVFAGIWTASTERQGTLAASSGAPVAPRNPPDG